MKKEESSRSCANPRGHHKTNEGGLLGCVDVEMGEAENRVAGEALKNRFVRGGGRLSAAKLSARGDPRSSAFSYATTKKPRK